MIHSFNEYIKESKGTSITAWHSSYHTLDTFDEFPTWFTDDIELAKEYHKTNPDDNTYRVEITGRILSEAELKQLCFELGIDYDEMVTDLVCNPSKGERKEIADNFREYCDGFYHWDHDPTDYNNEEGVLVIFLFNPNKNAKIITKEF